MKHPTVHFSINLREDAENWARVAKTDKPRYGRTKANYQSEIPADMLKALRPLSRRQAATYVYHDLKKRQHKFMTDFLAMQSLLEEYFDTYGPSLLKVVAKLVDKPLYAKNFYATFTLLGTCPYNTSRRWFMIPAKRNMPGQLKVVCHEMLHLQFIHYYERYCKKRGLDEKQFQDLKEALTVLLNQPIFRPFHIALDVGYSDHTKLREWIMTNHSKFPTFTDFLDEAIEETKRQFPLVPKKRKS